MAAVECSTTMATDTPTATTGHRVGIAHAVIVIADLFRGGVSSEHLDTTTAEKTSCDSGRERTAWIRKRQRTGLPAAGERNSPASFDPPLAQIF
jgi:hypothetical protein